MKFFIPGPLPGMNEIIAASKEEIPWLSTGKKKVYKITMLKKLWTERVKIAFLEDIGWLKEHIKKPIHLYCLWIEPNNRRDPDNVFAGVKFITDGLELVGFIKRDSRKWIHGIQHDFGKNDPKNPGVIVRIFQ